jgi:DNA (cytosine-5)-methyltransferase 1
MKLDHKSAGNVIDLFAGVGGLSLGAARAGFNVALAVERDVRIAAAHKLNFPTTRHSHQDIRFLSGKDVLELSGLDEVDGVIGGPPCQGFSSIGRKNSADSRNGLFAKFFKLVAEIKPRFFVAENVPGILDDKHASLRVDALAHVSDYETLGPFTICAADHGAPTTRTRVFFIGFKKGSIGRLSLDDFAPSADVARINVSEALKGLPTKIKDSWDIDKLAWRKIRRHCGSEFWGRVFGHIPPGVGHMETIARLDREDRVSGCIATRHLRSIAKRYGSLLPGAKDAVTRSVRLDASGFCPTLRAGTGSDRGSYQAVRPIHPTQPRVITPREAARLQGFPDWFRFDETKWHSFRQIGNSVSPIVGEHVLEVIAKNILIRKMGSSLRVA